MSEEFVSYILSKLKGNELVGNNSQQQKEKGNQYDKYIENTEKISSK